MIKFEEIAKHYSEKENSLPRMVLKEYLQYKILEIIFSSKIGHKFVFMGGTSVRLVYGSDRFSEDIDIDNTGISQKEFVYLVNLIKQELLKEGLEIEIRNVFKNVYHCYIKFPLILFNNKLSFLKDEKILIRIDSYYSKEKFKHVVKIVNKADIFTEVNVYPESLILSQKIYTLFNRKRAKGRDIYDVVYLSSLTKPDYDYLDKKLKIKNIKQLKMKLEKLFTKKELEELSTDVEPFLINQKNINRILKFNEWIKDFK